MSTAIMHIKSSAPWRVTVPIALVLLGGCASLPKDLGRSDVDALVKERGQPVEASEADTGQALVGSLTAEPLTAESAIRIALVNNPRLKATYALLGFAAADIYEASRIRNPIFSAAFLDSNQPGGRDQITFGLLTSFTDLLTLGARKRLATAEFAVMKQSIGAEVLEMAANAESAYYRFVAAKQVAALRKQVAKAGALSAALAERYHEAGNLTPRDLALERAAASEAQLDELGAEADAYGARANLATVLGLSVAGTWDSPAQLPVPLDQEDAISDLLTLARKSRLDLAAAHARADIIADRLGIIEWTRWLGELDVGVERERETDGTRITGPTLDWEVPIFNQHKDAVLRANADLQIAIADVERLSTAIENGVRLSYTATKNAKARAVEYRDRLIPARVAAVARAQEEESFMLIGIFELLATKQQEYDAYQGYLEVVRDYWLARAELTRAVGNTLPSSANIGSKRLDVEEYIRPKTGGKHSGHGAMPDHSRMAPMDDSTHTMDSDHSMEDDRSPNKTTEPHDEHEGHGSDHDTDGGS